MPHYKLTYFDTRGRAEAARQIFALAGVEFDDVRVARDAWPALKPQTPFGQIPVLEVDGVQIAQSTAIARFLGNSFGLAGKTPAENAKLDMIVDQVNDAAADFRPFIRVAQGHAEGDKEALKAQVFVPARDKHFPLLTKFLSGDSFILGERITWADVYVAEHLAILAALVPDALDGFPELAAFERRVHAQPKLAVYLAKRK